MRPVSNTYGLLRAYTTDMLSLRQTCVPNVQPSPANYLTKPPPQADYRLSQTTALTHTTITSTMDTEPCQRAAFEYKQAPIVAT